MSTNNLGHVTAYGYAKSKGYTGTEAQFAQLMADFAGAANTAVEAASEAEGYKDAAAGYASDATTAATNAQSYRVSAETSAQEAEQAAADVLMYKGSPLAAATAAGMTDTDHIYVYTGSEVGYTTGNWYYYNGASWVSGGVYNSVAVQTDPTLSVSNVAADAKAAGDMLGELNNQLGITNKSTLVALSQLEQGIYNSSGNKANSGTRIRSINKIRIARGAIVKFTAGTTIKSWCYVSYNEAGTKFFASSWLTEDSVIRLSSETGYVALMFKKDDATSITPASYDATASVDLYNEYNIEISLENGALTSSDPERFNLGYQDTHRRNKYPLMVNGCVTVMLPIGTGTILFCNSSGGVVESHAFSNSGNAFFDIPSTVSYVDVDITGTANSVTITFFGKASPGFTKRIYRNSGDTIRNDINIGGSLYTNIAYKLPPNYTANGDPVPLVLWIAGNNGYPQFGSGFPTSALTGLEYLRDDGYAVLQVYSWGSYYATKYPLCGKDQPYPVPIALRCLRMGIEYFCDRYNIDANNIHVVGRSFGGQMALHFALHPFEGLKSVTMFDPVIDLLSMRGRFSDARKALAEELSLAGDMGDFADINEDGSTATGVPNYYFSPRCMLIWEQNMPDVNRLNVSWDGLTDGTLEEHYNDSIADAQNWWSNGQSPAITGIYDNDSYHQVSSVPVLMAYALDDSSTPTQAMAEKIAQLRNAGNPTGVYTVPSGGHDAVSVSNTYAEDITTDLGILCEDVPIGWIEADKWMKKNA